MPIGDAMLFPNYSFCLNLGGFANVSFNQNNKLIAYDICPANIVLNAISLRLGKKFDPKGMLAAKGKINETILKKLNTLAYYKLKPPKSLGKEWVLSTIIPLLKKSGSNPLDLLRTFTEHIAIQIAQINEQVPTENFKSIPLEHENITKSIFITGGGTYNEFLLERIKAHSINKITIPDKKTIEFKEALIFAFLGVLRWRNEVNCLKSVTGATTDSIVGCIYL